MLSHTLQFQHHRVHVTEFNPRARQVIVALHGFSGDGRDFRYLSEHLPQWRIIAPDWFGHAGSPAPTTDVTEALRWQRQLLQLVVSHFPATAILGYSMGARIALHAAVSGALSALPLLLIGCSPGLDDPADRAARQYADRQWAHLLLEEGIDAFRKRWLQQPVLASQQTLPPAIAADLAQRRRSHSPAGLAWCIHGLSPGTIPSVWQQLQYLKQPIHCISGSDDEKFIAIATAMIQRAPHSTHTIVAGSGHSPHFEQPARLAHVVRTLLSAP